MPGIPVRVLERLGAMIDTEKKAVIEKLLRGLSAFNEEEALDVLELVSGLVGAWCPGKEARECEITPTWISSVIDLHEQLLQRAVPPETRALFRQVLPTLGDAQEENAQTAQQRAQKTLRAFRALINGWPTCNTAPELLTCLYEVTKRVAWFREGPVEALRDRSEAAVLRTLQDMLRNIKEGSGGWSPPGSALLEEFAKAACRDCGGQPDKRFGDKCTLCNCRLARPAASAGRGDSRAQERTRGGSQAGRQPHKMAPSAELSKRALGAAVQQRQPAPRGWRDGGGGGGSGGASAAAAGEAGAEEGTPSTPQQPSAPIEPSAGEQGYNDPPIVQELPIPPAPEGHQQHAAGGSRGRGARGSRGRQQQRGERGSNAPAGPGGPDGGGPQPQPLRSASALTELARLADMYKPSPPPPPTPPPLQSLAEASSDQPAVQEPAAGPSAAQHPPSEGGKPAGRKPKGGRNKHRSGAPAAAGGEDGCHGGAEPPAQPDGASMQQPPAADGPSEGRPPEAGYREAELEARVWDLEAQLAGVRGELERERERSRHLEAARVEEGARRADAEKGFRREIGTASAAGGPGGAASRPGGAGAPRGELEPKAQANEEDEGAPGPPFEFAWARPDDWGGEAGGAAPATVVVVGHAASDRVDVPERRAVDDLHARGVQNVVLVILRKGMDAAKFGEVANREIASGVRDRREIVRLVHWRESVLPHDVNRHAVRALLDLVAYSFS
eukprot:tig00020629_g12368.t1